MAQSKECLILWKMYVGVIVDVSSLAYQETVKTSCELFWRVVSLSKESLKCHPPVYPSWETHLPLMSRVETEQLQITLDKQTKHSLHTCMELQHIWSQRWTCFGNNWWCHELQNNALCVVVMSWIKIRIALGLLLKSSQMVSSILFCVTKPCIAFGLLQKRHESKCFS